MLITLVGFAVVATLLGQIAGYIGRVNKKLFVCWAISAACAVAVFWLNRQDASRLKQELAVRDITADEMKEASSKLTRFSAQPARISVFPVNFEGVWIADRVYRILLDAHWDVQFLDRPSAPPGKGLMVQGILIDCSRDAASKEVATALCAVLDLTVGTSQVPCSGKF